VIPKMKRTRILSGAPMFVVAVEPGVHCEMFIAAEFPAFDPENREFFVVSNLTTDEEFEATLKVVNDAFRNLIETRNKKEKS